MKYNSSFRIFAGNPLTSYFSSKFEKLRSEILDKNQNDVLNVNEDDYISYLTSRYQIDNLLLMPERKTVLPSERQIPASAFPSNFNVHRGQSYNRQVITFYIPFTGDPNLLKYIPASRTYWTMDVYIDNSCICFDIIDFAGEAESISASANQNIDLIVSIAQSVAKDVSEFNIKISELVREIFGKRKSEILKNRNLVASLGVPIRTETQFAATFTIPTPEMAKPIRISEPVVANQEYKPDPTLEEGTYQDILQIIHDMGKQFERTPSTYNDKSEEALRDQFLLMLSPRFQGTVTGETFNKSGKTDILMRYQGSNVFVAECKFWSGKAKYLETISQLLGYLTWRDSKAAVIIFVKNNDFSSVVESIEEETPNHSNYRAFVNKIDETWLNYRFHINNDVNRQVRLAVLPFHIPKVK